MRRLMGVAAALALTACRETLPPGSRTPSLEYTLVTIDGNAPPQVIGDGENGVESILAGYVLLGSNGSYVDSTVIQVVNRGQVSMRHDVARGPYRSGGDTVFFTFGLGGYHMVRNGVDLVQNFGGTILVYRR